MDLCHYVYAVRTLLGVNRKHLSIRGGAIQIGPLLKLKIGSMQPGVLILAVVCFYTALGKKGGEKSAWSRQESNPGRSHEPRVP